MLIRLSVAFVVFSSCAAALAQSTADQPALPLPTTEQGITFSFSPELEHAFGADIDGGNGDMSRDVFSAALGMSTTLGPRWSVNGSLRYTFETFDFGSGSAAMGGFGGLNAGDGPWDDVHTLQLSARFKYELDNRWNLYVGPVIRFARESGADLADGFEGGGFAAASYDVSDTFTFGLGAGVISQIEDDPRLFPIVILNYRFADDFALGTSTGSNRSGIELVYSGFEDVELAVGGGAMFRRFRLDDSGVAPDGVGEISGTPVWARVGWTPRSDLSIGVIGGIILDGELRLEDDGGDRIASPDLDNQPFIGISARIAF